MALKGDASSPVIVIDRVHAARAILNDPGTRRVTGRILPAAAHPAVATHNRGAELMAMWQSAHRPLRHTLAHAFRSAALDNHAGSLRARARVLLRALADSGDNTIEADFIEPFVAGAALQLTGIGKGDAAVALHCAEAFSSAHGRISQLDFGPEAATGWMGALFEPLLTGPVAEEALVMQAAQRAIASGDLDREQALSLLTLSFFAALTNTRDILRRLIGELASDPTLREKCANGEIGLDAVCDEAVRLGVRLALVRLPEAGGVVRVDLVAANRDPELYPNPTDFDPWRRQPHLGFGAGMYQCAGKRFAMLQLRTAASVFVELFPVLPERIIAEARALRDDHGG